MKVLVVDDTQTMLAMMCQMLVAMGIDCLPAKTGAEALAAYREGKPDCILLDVELPDMSGFDIARTIRREEGSTLWTPIIFLTGLANDASLAAGIDAGGDDYLVKPVSETVLSAKIGAMQRIKAMRDRLIDVTQQLESANERLRGLAAADGLTGLANRRHFDEQLDREWRRSLREDIPLALIMVDVDHFKQFNDTYGHQLGDDCLKRVAKALCENARRPGDIAARYGGEEFVVLLPGTLAEGARHVAAAIRSAIASMGIEHRKSSVAEHVTASLGVGCAEPKRFRGDAKALLKLADKALYEAKHRGRNRVVWVDTTAGPRAAAN